MEQNQYKEIILSQKNEFLNLASLMKRDVLNNFEFKEIPHIIVIKGIRRCGKSVLLSQINDFFYKKSYSYVNFDDERFLSFNVEEFTKLYDAFLSLDIKQNVLFFDEIQEIDSWEKAIRRLYDKKIKFYVTGSNASLLSKELGSKLTGRHIQIELFPFSFLEFLKFNNFNLEEKDILISERRVQIKNLFDEYFKKGGMPEYISYNKKEIIHQVYEDILLKDIVVRYGLNDEKSLKQLTKYLLSNVGKPYSYNSLAKLNEIGSSTTVKNYINYLENAYLIFELERYDYSIQKQIKKDKKVYAIDVSFINLISFEFSENLGRKIENIVFLELKRKGLEIYYYKDKNECDFVIKKGLKILEAIQVCYNLDEDNRKREIGGLLEAMEKFNLKEGLLLTYDQEEKIIVDKKKITIKPVWKWLLE